MLWRTDALALPARELGRETLGQVPVETHHVHQIQGAFAGLVLGNSVEDRDRSDVVDDAPVREQPPVLQHVPDGAPQCHGRLLCDVGPSQQHTSLGRCDHLVDHAHQRGLTGARRPQQHRRGVLGNVQGDPAHPDGPVRVDLVDFLEPDHQSAPYLTGQGDETASRERFFKACSLHCRDDIGSLLSPRNQPEQVLGEHR